jgi:hypothetical protein
VVKKNLLVNREKAARWVIFPILVATADVISALEEGWEEVKVNEKGENNSSEGKKKENGKPSNHKKEKKQTKWNWSKAGHAAIRGLVKFAFGLLAGKLF